MLDEKDIQNLIEAQKEIFVTKEDLEVFATKEDLEVFATKEDLEVFATKEDLEVFATKDDLKNINKNIDNKFDNFALMVQKGFNDITEKMATKIELQELRKEMHDKFDELKDQEIKPLKERMRKVENALAIE